MRNIVVEIGAAIAQQEAVGQKSVAIAMSWEFFLSPRVEKSFIELGMEAEYTYSKLYPQSGFSLCGLPVCMYFGKAHKPWTFAVASVVNSR